LLSLGRNPAVSFSTVSNSTVAVGGDVDVRGEVIPEDLYKVFRPERSLRLSPLSTSADVGEADCAEASGRDLVLDEYFRAVELVETEAKLPVRLSDGLCEASLGED
jgi:hypothetical protein